MSPKMFKAIYSGTMSLLKVCLLALPLVIYTMAPATAQQCPGTSETGPTASEVPTLEGKLVFHDGLRKWFELKLDQPQCGQTSIELVRREVDRTSLQVLRGCRVRSRGVIDFSLTGYYSLPTYQAVDQIDSIGACRQQLPFPDYSNAKPDRSIREYRVDMHVKYGSGDHPIMFRISSAGKTLRPWQAYANYLLTGGFVLYGQCGDGFVVDKVFGTRQANPSHFDEPRTLDDMAMFDPETAAASGKRHLDLGYTCVRKP